MIAGFAPFKIRPRGVAFDIVGSHATFELSDGRVFPAEILSETNARRETFEYVFISVPRDALYNDDECQPRAIRLNQVWAIYSDLQQNPLHEPPGCRILRVRRGQVHLAMFDGQHKTLANWLMGRSTIAVKVYLNLTREGALELVNSVQSRVRKLPLSPFEATARYSLQFADKYLAYAEKAGVGQDSEAGFIESLPPSRRRHGVTLLREALMQRILRDPNFTLASFVKRHGTTGGLISERSVKQRVLTEVIDLNPRNEVGQKGERARLIERDNVVEGVNLLTEEMFGPLVLGPGAGYQVVERRRRFAYQASLTYCAQLLRMIYRDALQTESGAEFTTRRADEREFRRISVAVDRLVQHSAWVADMEPPKTRRRGVRPVDPKMLALRAALLQNSGYEAAFAEVGLTAAYVLGFDHRRK